MYDADSMSKGVGTLSRIRGIMFPHGPPSGLGGAQNVPAAQEMLEGHCLTCKTSRPFAVEGEDQMPNGAIRKFGTSGHPECGHKISHFVKGTKVSASA
jgi:hypothetical protein